MTPLTKSRAHGSGFEAAKMLLEHGIASITTEQLFLKIDFGQSGKGRRDSLNRAIASGWLARDNDQITIGAPGLDFLADAPEAPTKYQGSTAQPRDTGNVYDRPALSKKHIPNSKGTRADVPAFSVRESVSFRTLAGGQA